jgi:hypothetical protein
MYAFMHVCMCTHTHVNVFYSNRRAKNKIHKHTYMYISVHAHIHTRCTPCTHDRICMRTCLSCVHGHMCFIFGCPLVHVINLNPAPRHAQWFDAIFVACIRRRISLSVPCLILCACDAQHLLLEETKRNKKSPAGTSAKTDSCAWMLWKILHPCPAIRLFPVCLVLMFLFASNWLSTQCSTSSCREKARGRRVFWILSHQNLLDYAHEDSWQFVLISGGWPELRQQMSCEYSMLYPRLGKKNTPSNFEFGQFFLNSWDPAQS